MTAKPIPWLIVMLLPLLLLGQGCQLAGVQHAAGGPLPVAVKDETAELLSHPQFKAAAVAAPEWTGAALAKIRQLAKQKADAGVP